MEKLMSVVDDAWERHIKIKNLYYSAKENFIDLGEELCLFQDKEQYKDLGYQSFNEYLADPDGLDIGRSTAFMFMGIYRKYIEELRVPKVQLIPAGPDKLDRIRSKVNLTEDNVDEWITEAKALSRSDLIIRLDGKDVLPEWRDIFIRMWQLGNELRRMNIPRDLMNLITDFLDYSESWK
jgi:hypothetical protein